MINKQLLVERLYRNGLITPFDTAKNSVHHLGGVQAQVQQFAEIALLNRSAEKLTPQKLSDLYQDHTFINFWGQRNTLHMYTAQDWDLFCSIYHDKMYIQKQKSIYQEFFSVLEDQLYQLSAAKKIVTRKEIDQLIQASAPENLRDNDYLTYMMLNYFCANGLLFGIPAKPSVQQFATFATLNKEPWQQQTNHDEASLEKLMLRYFTYYGPATAQDFSHWSGLSMKVFNDTLNLIKSDLNLQIIQDRTYYSFGEYTQKNTRKLLVLGKFDPLFVAYRHKDWIATPEQQKAIWRSAGHVESVILEGSKLLGTWRHVLKGQKLMIQIEPLTTISLDTQKRIYGKMNKIALFWKKDLVDVVYK
ncbi:DNA glycosylase AlkZ-like family protein [Candidatus Enterococcus ferrettii]|uniref:Winged helix DNA-binding domain-containing protein n=1 Tax=Candidatus Enterococcus ferrettii TaxID=2815324 RepID=A0ABV0ET92_9ENTE|nr:crosslink repair DNA glycosylase YcaQ family protein [Enterococcus sp. 665A]MBO1340210.1 winged helix DNA-binding domain-containing protein [Enterococcus sp. 665A]